eukprot:3141426-Lingulodinium_polyedra.AAC.1
MKGGDIYEALDLFVQVQKELTEAIYASGPGSANYMLMLMEAHATTQQNIDAINLFDLADKDGSGPMNETERKEDEKKLNKVLDKGGSHGDEPIDLEEI